MRERVSSVVMLCVPFVPKPNQEQRQALALASQFLDRAAASVETQLLEFDAHSTAHMQFGDLCRGYQHAARLLEVIADLTDARS